MNKTRKAKIAKELAFSAITIYGLSIFLGIDNSFATTSVVDDVTVTVPASCTISSIVNSNHTATVEVGSYVDDIGETTFKVICNDSEGFSVYAVGYTNDQFGNTTMKPGTVADTNAIATGLATSGDTSNWAMKLTAVTGDYAPTLETGFNNYHVVPAEYTKVASYSANTDSSSGSSFKSTYAAFITSAQPADTYTGKVKYTVVHPASELPPAESISQLTYMQDFKNLTAEQRTSVLNSMSYNTTYNLIDNRDNKTYQIARLKDDNIWMAENLDLGRTALGQDLTAANTNLLSDNAAVSASTFNTWTKSSGTGTKTAAELISVSGVDATSGTSYGTLYNYCAASAGTICSVKEANDDNATSDLCPAGWRLPTGGYSASAEFNTLYNIDDYNTPAKMRASISNGGAAFAFAGFFSTSVPNSQNESGGYWSSTNQTGSNMFRLSISSSRVAPSDINGRETGYALRCIVKKKSSHTLSISYGTGISHVKIGGVTIADGETVELDEELPYSIMMVPDAGYYAYWSATSGTIDYADAWTTTYVIGDSDATLTVNASYVTTEMQNLSSSACTATASRVKDNRDNHVYTIQRLADGKCWMMDNLDLGRTTLTTDLTSSNTNLTNTVTASTFNSWKKTSGSNSFTTSEYIPVDGTDFTSKTQYGTLYNYCAASAGTICAADSSNNDDATNDLCPAGWRLPIGGSSGEFQALYSLTNYRTNAKMRAPIANGGAAFALAGSFYNSNPSSKRSEGYYWSSKKNDGMTMYDLYLDTSSVRPAHSERRVYGFAIRCVSDI